MARRRDGQGDSGAGGEDCGGGGGAVRDSAGDGAGDGGVLRRNTITCSLEKNRAAISQRKPSRRNSIALDIHWRTADVRAQPSKEALALGGEDLGGGAEGGEAAFAKKQNFGAGGERVGGVVCGHDGLNVILTQPNLQADEKRIAGDAVERGEGFIEEKQSGTGRQCSRQSHALRLAAGEILRAA